MRPSTGTAGLSARGNQLTDSAATYDAHLLTSQTNAVLVGQPAEDPVDNYGSSDGLLRLRGSGIVIKYSTKTSDPHQIRMGIPDLSVAPSIGQILAGQDPVLKTALNSGRHP